MGAIFAISMPAQADWYADSRPMMGTEISVRLWHDEPEKGRALVEQVFKEAKRIDLLMSTYIDDSRISTINREAADHPVVAGDELFLLIERAIEISSLTQGAFDISYESVGQHYDFRKRERPDEVTVASNLALIDYQLISLDPANGTVEFGAQGVRINLGGIAKGYVVERGVDLLRVAGVQHAVVTAGGDSRLLGDRRGQPWMVGIRDPRVDGEVAMTVPLQEEAISTSGDYERFFDEDGVRYHHIISPKTGDPASGVHSATVLGPDAVTTDALSTSVFIMGVELGMQLIATLPKYECIVIDDKGQIFFSDGLMQP